MLITRKFGFPLNLAKCVASARVYIGNLDFEANTRDVERFFNGYGRITDVKVKKGFAFVEFENTKYAEDAIRHLDQKKLLGRPLSLQKPPCILQSFAIEVVQDPDPEYVAQEEIVMTIVIFQLMKRYGPNLQSALVVIMKDLLLDDENILAKEVQFVIVIPLMKDQRNETIEDVIRKAIILVLYLLESGLHLHQSRSSDSRSPRPRLKLGLVERIRLREALKKRQVEEGEVLSEIEELNLDRRLKSPSPIADREIDESSATSETLKVGSIETTPETKLETETVKERNTAVIECSISEEEDFTEDEITTERSIQTEEKPILTDPEELKAYASSASERELSVEI